MLQRGTTLEHNKYYIEDVIGQGGFGHVYRARERLTGEVVAIKELTIGLDNREIVQRFVQEARATLRLTHPYIARTYGIFHDRGTYYLTMEYLPGGSLADRLRRGRLPMRDAVRIATNVCKALAYAHDKGVVHCDIKPANVLFDKDGEVRLADFGIAHVSEQMMTRKLFTATGMMMGTVRYMAPEQLEGVRDDPRVDIYAMGVMLYEMLAGRPYLDFETETTPAAQVRNIQRIQSESPRPLRAVNPAAPAWLAEAVARALHKRPEDRFATAASLGRALQPPPPPPRRAVETSTSPDRPWQ
ncbi:MAG: protein kinase, partial [Chloroflexi bacterium]|nr:protein kinase [Chloroflexota bacterium]